MIEPRITVAVPSLNHGRFLNDALRSIFSQDVPVEVVVLDAGSTDNSLSVIRNWKSRLLWWRSRPDAGQAAAINEGIARGKAPYVCWLNADDMFLPGGVKKLWKALEASPEIPAAYGRCWTVTAKAHKICPFITTPFWPRLLTNYCFIAQPATLIRRSIWESIGGLDENLHMALDYDLWWRLYRRNGKLKYVRKFVAATRMHFETKTSRKRKEHYTEAMEVVLRHTGKIPIKWHLAWPVMVNFRKSIQKLRDSSHRKE